MISISPGWFITIPNSSHLSVVALLFFTQNNFLFFFTCFAGNIEEPEVIMARLKYILNKEIKSEEYPLGAMTTENRNTWATLRRHLIENDNQKALDQIDSALFCLCLDDVSYGENDIISLTRDGLCGHEQNRLFKI